VELALRVVLLTMADPPAAPLDIAPSPAPPPGIGIGTWAWGNRFLWGYDPAQDGLLEHTFRRAVELGLGFVDTADSYGTGRWNGRSEALLGRFCSGLPADLQARVQVATKLAPFPWRLGRGGLHRGFQASRRRLEGHLQRVQLHWSTARYAPWQEDPLLDGLADLVLAGEVAELGVSNMGPRRLRQVQARLAARGVRLTSLQVQLSLLSPEPILPGGLAALCRELEIELIAYSPLALGLLGRADGDGEPRPRGPRGALFARLEPQLGPLRRCMAAIAEPHGAPPAAVALNWCRAHGARPIVGLRTPAQAELAAGALAWQLRAEQRHQLDALALDLNRRMPANPFQSS
jgi:pyridoxine 4-dehydrogenase